ncbi:uncharacterized protein LOC143236821 isoform X2 [Tachypleus tridentatus]
MTEQHKLPTICTGDRSQEISGRTLTLKEDHHPAAIGSLMIPDPTPSLNKDHNSNIKPEVHHDVVLNVNNQHGSSSSKINMVLGVSTQSAVTEKGRESPPGKEMQEIAISVQKSGNMSNELNKGSSVLLGNIHTPLNQSQSSDKPKEHSPLEGQSQSVCSSRLDTVTSCGLSLERKSNESNLSTNGAKYGAFQGDSHNNSNGFMCDKNTKTELYTQAAPIYCVSVTVELADFSRKENCCVTNANKTAYSEFPTSKAFSASSINFSGNSENKQRNHDTLCVLKSKTQKHDDGRDEAKTNTFVFSELSCPDKFHEETTSNENCDKDRFAAADVKQSSLDEILSSLEKIRDEFELSSTQLENTTTSKTISGKEAPVASLSECSSGFGEAIFASESVTNKEAVHALGCEHVFADLSKISCDNISANKAESHNSTCFLKHPSESIEKNYVFNVEKDGYWNSSSVYDSHRSENESEMLSSPLLSQKPGVNGFNKFLSQLKVKCRDPLKAENAVIMKKWGLNDSQQPSMNVNEVKEHVSESWFKQDQSNNNSEYVTCQDKREHDARAVIKPGEINYEIQEGKSEIATNNNNKPPEPKVEQIQHILAGLDFSKYRRGQNIYGTDQQINSSVGMESKHNQNVELDSEDEHIASHQSGIDMDTNKDDVRIVDQLRSQQDHSVVENNAVLNQDAVVLDVVSFCPEVKRYTNEKGKTLEVSKNINKCINSNSLSGQHNVKEGGKFLEQSDKSVADSNTSLSHHNFNVRSEKHMNVIEKVKPTLCNSSAKTFMFNTDEALQCNNGIMRTFFPINRSSSFPQVKVFSNNSYEKSKIFPVNKQSKEFNQQYFSSQPLLNNPSAVLDKSEYIDTVAQHRHVEVISGDLNNSDLSVNSANKSVNKETFVLDYDSCLKDKLSSYSILPSTNKTVLLSDESRQFSGFEINKDINVVRSFKVDYKSDFQEVKCENNECLSYRTQCRKSVPEEEILQSSTLDNNTLSPLETSPLAVRKFPQQSELSLSDSFFNRNVIVDHETFEHTVGMITHSTGEMCSAKRSEKLLKKKYHSDPSGSIDIGSVEFPEIISRYRSEPGLGDGNEERHQRHQQRVMLHGRKTSTELFGLACLIPQQSVSHGFGSTSSCFSKQSCFAECQRNCNLEKEKPSKSPDQQMRYSKKRLRGPYGEMLEEEMRKSGEKLKLKMDEDLRHLEETREENTVQKTTCATETLAKVSLSQLHVRPCDLPSSHFLDQVDFQKSSTCIDTDMNNKNTSANVLYVQSGKSSTQLISSVSLSSFSCDSTSSETNTVISFEDAAKPDQLLAADNTGVVVLEKKDHCQLERVGSPQKHQDTRTHVVGEIYDTEVSYVDSLKILVNKYMKPLKSSENAGLVDIILVDEIFYKIPEILTHHERFSESLHQRLSYWDNKQKIGDLFVDAFTKQHVIDTYTAFINNWKSAKEAIKLASQAKPAFAKFLQHMAREHKGKLTLDALLIMPVQRIPRYELLIKELLKHTPVDHPDYQSLVLAQKEIHDLAVKINRMEREAFQNDQLQQRLKEISQLIEGVIDLVQPDRIFIRYDQVSITGGLGIKKDRCIFLFSDILIITSIKKRSGTIRKPSTSSNSPSTFGTLEMNKYKMLMRFPLDNLDIAKSTDTNIKKAMKEIENLEEDISLLGRINELVGKLKCQHQILDEAVEEVLNAVSKQLIDKQTTDPQLLSVQLTVTSPEGVDTINIVYPTPEKRSSWETAFNEAKQKLALYTNKRPPPEFLYPLPIRKTRAGLQFTCAAPTLSLNQLGLKYVWVCNSDGYVGQVCILSLHPEPTVTSCNGVCSARIVCMAAIPAANSVINRRRSFLPESSLTVNSDIQDIDSDADQSSSEKYFRFDSDSSTDDDDGESQEDDSSNKQSSEHFLLREDSKEELDNQQPTMWLGTEDGCIHIYNCNDNIRIKKHKLVLQHSFSIQCIIYLDNRVFVALTNGDVIIYQQDLSGGWNTTDPQCMFVGSVTAPVTKMLAVAGKVWCACQNYIKVLNTTDLEIELSFQVTSDTSKTVLCMVTSGLGVWIAVQHSAILRLFHATTYGTLLEVNVAPAVTKMLSGCDDIIRQHKAACLRVTALLACKDHLWVGTSAGVILTMSLPHLTFSTFHLDNVPNVVGVPHGHTGHVRFLTYVETVPGTVIDTASCSKYVHRSGHGKEGAAARRMTSSPKSTTYRFLVISGGDGYEDFSHSGQSDVAGREDSTNHLLL